MFFSGWGGEGGYKGGVAAQRDDGWGEGGPPQVGSCLTQCIDHRSIYFRFLEDGIGDHI